MKPYSKKKTPKGSVSLNWPCNNKSNRLRLDKKAARQETKKSTKESLDEEWDEFLKNEKGSSK